MWPFFMNLLHRARKFLNCLNVKNHTIPMDTKAKSIKWVLIGGGILIIFLPYILSLKSFYFTYSIPGTPEQFANTIAGMTAPAIGILTAYLMYQAFYQQLIANKQVRDQLKAGSDTEILKELIKDLKTDHFDLFKQNSNQPNAYLPVTNYGRDLIYRKVINKNLFSYVNSVLTLLKQVESNDSPLLKYELARLNHLSGDIFSFHFEYLNDIPDKRGMGETAALRYNVKRVNGSSVEIKISTGPDDIAASREVIKVINKINEMLSRMKVFESAYFEGLTIYSNLKEV